MEPPDGAGYRRAYRDDAHEFEFDDRIEDPPPEIGARSTASQSAAADPGRAFIECLRRAAAAANPETTGALRVVCGARPERIWDLCGSRPRSKVPIRRRGRRGAHPSKTICARRRFQTEVAAARHTQRRPGADPRLALGALAALPVAGRRDCGATEDRGRAATGESEPHTSTVRRARRSRTTPMIYIYDGPQADRDQGNYLTATSASPSPPRRPRTAPACTGPRGRFAFAVR